MTSPDVFWQLFRTSGHVGAYLLYAWYDQATPRSTIENDDLDIDTHTSGAEVSDLSPNGQLG